MMGRTAMLKLEKNKNKKLKNAQRQKLLKNKIRTAVTLVFFSNIHIWKRNLDNEKKGLKNTCLGYGYGGKFYKSFEDKKKERKKESETIISSEPPTKMSKMQYLGNVLRIHESPEKDITLEITTGAIGKGKPSVR